MVKNKTFYMSDEIVHSKYPGIVFFYRFYPLRDLMSQDTKLLKL